MVCYVNKNQRYKDINRNRSGIKTGYGSGINLLFVIFKTTTKFQYDNNQNL